MIVRGNSIGSVINKEMMTPKTYHFTKVSTNAPGLVSMEELCIAYRKGKIIRSKYSVSGDI